MRAHVPQKFLPKISVEYPPHNKVLFEEYFMNQPDVMCRSVYLPVQWTAFHVNNGYGKKNAAFQELQDFIDGLDRDQSYYTIVQYDDGCLVDFKDLDILIFNMSDGDGPRNYPIPLLCQTKPFVFPDHGRDVFASFVGGMTHPLRMDMFNAVSDSWNVYISKDHHNIEDYCRIMSRSIFALCPRGYGKNSFRIAEAMQYGAIPVYISDSFVMPFNEDFEKFGICIHERDIPNIDAILNRVTAEKIWNSRRVIPEYYNRLYTYEGARQRILEVVC